MRDNFIECYRDVLDKFHRKTNEKYSIGVYLNTTTFDHDIILSDATYVTGRDFRRVRHTVPRHVSHDDFYKILKDMLKELEGENYVDPDAVTIEPVSELLLVTVDISVNEDAPCIKVGKSVGTGCCREIKIVNTITGDEAIELYKKLVGG